jgi:hypothetical protein
MLEDLLADKLTLAISQSVASQTRLGRSAAPVEWL